MSFPSNTKRFHDGIMILQNSENDIFQNTLSKKKKKTFFKILSMIPAVTYQLLKKWSWLIYWQHTQYIYLGRYIITYLHTGPSITYLRNNFCYANSCLEHINDLHSICCKSIFVVADNWTNYNAISCKNALLYYLLWQGSGLDCLTIK